MIFTKNRKIQLEPKRTRFLFRGAECFLATIACLICYFLMEFDISRHPIKQKTQYNFKYSLLNMAVGTSCCGSASYVLVFGPFVPIYRTEDRLKYFAILVKHMLPHAKQRMECNWEFLQNNDSKHTSLHILDFLKKKKVKTLDQPEPRLKSYRAPMGTARPTG